MHPFWFRIDLRFVATLSLELNKHLDLSLLQASALQLFGGVPSPWCSLVPTLLCSMRLGSVPHRGYTLCVSWFAIEFGTFMSYYVDLQ